MLRRVWQWNFAEWRLNLSIFPDLALDGSSPVTGAERNAKPAALECGVSTVRISGFLNREPAHVNF